MQSYVIISVILMLLNRAFSTSSPSASPTAIPSSISQVPASAIPIALHQLVVVDSSGSSVIRLKSFDINSFNVSLRTYVKSSLFRHIHIKCFIRRFNIKSILFRAQDRCINYLKYLVHMVMNLKVGN